MTNIVSIKNLSKIYTNKFKALDNLSLDIKKGEIFALLGPNGAGKSTLINIICGIVNRSSGDVKVDNFDIIKDFRKTRTIIGLVPQELHLEQFETVYDTIAYSRGLHGKTNNKYTDINYLNNLLKNLSLFSRSKSKLRELSGGMKRRVLIAKALAHEPSILFLDEPTAGVDVELRKDLWETVKKLKENGVTVILTTHYLTEAEELSDRVGIINHGKIVIVDEKDKLMKKLGEKMLIIELQNQIQLIPNSLSNFNLHLSDDGKFITYKYDTKDNRTGITNVLNSIRDAGFILKDINTEVSSLESIFINLVKGSNDELSRN